MSLAQTTLFFVRVKFPVKMIAMQESNMQYAETVVNKEELPISVVQTILLEIVMYLIHRIFILTKGHSALTVYAQRITAQSWYHTITKLWAECAGTVMPGEPLFSLAFHILEGSKSLSSSKFIRREKLSFTASISSKEQGLRIQRFPRASGSSSKYFFIY